MLNPEAECNRLRSSINSQETEILELNCAVQSRDQSIRDLKSELKVAKEEILDRSCAVLSRDQTIKEQRDTICEANQELHEKDLLIKRQNVSKGANLIYDKLLVAESRIEFLERYTDEQGRTIMELEWQIHQLKEEG